MSFSPTLLKTKVHHDAIAEPFLSKRFHKELLTSEEPFHFKNDFVAKEGSSDYKKVRKRCSLKNLWLNGSLWNQKWFFYGIAVKNLYI